MSYLVLSSEAAANQAHKIIEANFIRYRSGWQDSKGFDKRLKTRIGRVDVTDKSDDDLKQNYSFQMEGEKNNILNSMDGFTERWISAPEYRESDRKWLIPIPEAGMFRDILLARVPQPNSIEDKNASSFSSK